MAKVNSAATTPEELAKQFPCTGRPFAVWYNPNPEAVNNNPWALNDENGEAVEEFSDMAKALKTAEEKGKEWADEARIQALALAKVNGHHPTENLTAAGSEIPKELADIQARLATLMANAQDDKSKKQIFNRIVVPLAELLPDVAPAKEPAPLLDSARCLLDAADKLREAFYLAQFIQSISLNVRADSGLFLQPEQLTGFYYAMENTIDRIKEAEVLINTARKQPEALPA